MIIYDLPDELWNECWQYATQAEYRCAITCINRHWLKLTKIYSCLPREQVSLSLFSSKLTIEQSQSILLQLEQPIKQLAIDEPFVLYSTTPTIQLQQILCQIEHLTLSYRQIIRFLQPLIWSFQQMHSLRSLSLDYTFLEALMYYTQLEDSCIKLLSQSLKHLNSFSLDGDNIQGSTLNVPWTLIQSLNLRVLRLRAISLHEEIWDLNPVRSEIHELYITNCICDLLIDRPIPLQLQQYHQLHVLSIVNCYGDWFSPEFVLPEIQSLTGITSLALENWYSNDLQALAQCAFISTLQRLYLHGLAQVDAKDLYLVLSMCKNLLYLEIEFTTHDTINVSTSNFSAWHNDTIQNACFILDRGEDVHDVGLDQMVLQFCQCTTNLQQLELSPEPTWWTSILNKCFDCRREDDEVNEIVGGYFNTDGRLNLIQLLQANISNHVSSPQTDQELNLFDL